ncbi:MAG: ROK family protein [Candidatus Giovannonibacteria bacterium]|nr:MAG: ROK family protein [Candidatus Giovannonibacteria bacterium]
MRKKIIVGLDIGGSKIRAVLWDGKKVLAAREAKTPKNLGGFKKILRKLFGGHSKIGIAVPGRIKGAVFVSATNMPYIRNFNFAEFFGGAKVNPHTKKFGVGVKVDHDARCFARAEHRDKRTTLFLTLGTGIGRAISKDGKILKIKSFEYPARWEKKYKEIRDSRNDDELAIFLAKKLKGIIETYKTEKVIIGGGVAARENFSDKLQKTLGLPVKKSKLGKNSVAIGAAMLFR